MTDAIPTHVFDVEEASFETEVLQASLQTPILLDFWAEWCGPCKSLGPLLEKLAAEFNGAFRLGKVDVEKQQELAAAFRIQSIPTVILLKDGQPLDGFAGALPEGQLREFLLRHLQPLEAGAAETATELPPETPQQTLTRLQQAVAAEPDQPELKLDLALALMHAGQAEAAAAELDALPANLATDDRAVRLRHELALAESLKGIPPRDALEQRITADPADWEARDQLGLRLLTEGDAAAGLEQFLVILEKARDWNDGAARKRLLSAFATLDDADLVGRYRRRMASLLF